MNPYVMMLLQRLQNLEGARIPLTRGAGGRYLPATAAQKIPLAPVTKGAAGLGAAGIVASDPGSRVPLPEGLIQELNARGADGSRGQTLPAEALLQARAMPMSVRETDSTLYGEDAGYRPAPMRISGYDPTLGGGDMPPGLEDAPMPPRRPIGVGAPMPPRRPETGAADSILRRIFSGQDYQSNSRPVVENRKVNWGDPESAADFFRADRAARELGTLPPVERASGGQVGQNKAHKDAALVKALEIIERLMSNGR